MILSSLSSACEPKFEMQSAISTPGNETWIWLPQIVELQKWFQMKSNSSQFPVKEKSKIRF